MTSGPPPCHSPEALPALAQWAAQATFAFPLPPRTRFILQGPDAFRYLNGQISNNLTKASEHQAIPACLLTIKGRVIAVPWIWKTDPDTFCLEVPEPAAETTQARLERYLVADQVEIVPGPAPPTWHICSPSEQSQPALGNRRCHRLNLPGRDTETPPPQDLPLLDPTTAEALRIALRIPDHPEWALDALPAELGLDSWAVDFHKGCYPGQEVVSRQEMSGAIRRKLIAWFSNHSLPENTPLVTDPHAPQELGRTATSLRLPHQNSFLGLALVRAAGIPPECFALPEPERVVRVQPIP